MSAEFWAIIGVGVGCATIVGALFTFLNVQISELRKDARENFNTLIEQIALSEKRMGDKIDGVERRLEARIDGVERRLEARIDGVERRLEARIDGLEVRIDGVEKRLEARIDGLEARLRSVEQGQARVIGAVDMMQAIVIATLRGEEVHAD